MQKKKQQFFIRSSKENKHFLAKNQRNSENNGNPDNRRTSLNLAMSNDTDSRYIERWISFESQLRRENQNQPNSSPLFLKISRGSSMLETKSQNDEEIPSEKKEGSFPKRSSNDLGIPSQASISIKPFNGGALFVEKKRVPSPKERVPSPKSKSNIMLHHPDQKRKLETLVKMQKGKDQKGTFYVTRSKALKPKLPELSRGKNEKSENQCTWHSKQAYSVQIPLTERSSNVCSSNSNWLIGPSLRLIPGSEPNENKEKIEAFLLKCVNKQLISQEAMGVLMNEYARQVNSGQAQREQVSLSKSRVKTIEKTIKQRRQCQSILIHKEKQMEKTTKQRGTWKSMKSLSSQVGDDCQEDLKETIKNKKLGGFLSSLMDTPKSIEESGEINDLIKKIIAHCDE